MHCRICTEFEQFLYSARQPDPPTILLGLTEAGKRNRAHQREEKIKKAESALATHRKTCMATAESAINLPVG